LYRLESSDGYYALLKRGGKQFRRSLKTKDRKLADRRLNELRTKIGCLKISADAKFNFEQAANLWLETNKHALISNTVKRRKVYIKGLTPYFRICQSATSPSKTATVGLRSAARISLQKLSFKSWTL
jgi:hypothetical protein